ncbi:hypothetical protein [Streptomyces violaceusniger]|uniref:hypothetical protein n=1 Tax=Streptomyces violaceusniger TaxID=68280 RepID=UPI0031DBD3EF
MSPSPSLSGSVQRIRTAVAVDVGPHQSDVLGADHGRFQQSGPYGRPGARVEAVR